MSKQVGAGWRRFWPAATRQSAATREPGVTLAALKATPRPLFSYPRAFAGTPCGRDGYAVVDLETTGLSPAQGHRIVEIGIVRVSADGQPQAEWSTLINPGGGRDTGAVGIHRITNEMVAHAPRFREVVDDILCWLGGAVVVAHNARFEAGFLTAAFAGVERDVPTLPAIDTLRLARQVVTCPDYRLSTLCSWAHVNLNDAHTALGDARATAQVLPALLRAHMGELTWDMQTPGLAVNPSGLCYPRPG